jgi:hypothetical protein
LERWRESLAAMPTSDFLQVRRLFSGVIIVSSDGDVLLSDYC